MEDKQLALAACDEGFKDGVEKLMGVLLVNWIDAKKAADKDVALQRFQSTLSQYKEARRGAATAIEKVFAEGGAGIQQIMRPPVDALQAVQRNW